MTGLWKTWMTLWCWATLAFGAVLAAAAFPGLEGPTVLFYDLVHWPVDGASSWSHSVRFTCGVLGAVMIGWALTIFTLVEAAGRLPSDLESKAWRGLTTAMSVWFVIDSAISIATGAGANAVSNAVFFGLYLIPVVASGVLGSGVGAPRSA